MNILTVCEGGNVRSVGLARILKVEHYHNVIAIGTMYALSCENGREPGTMLCRWAERIVYMSKAIYHEDHIPKDCHHKVRFCEVGVDVYGESNHPDLQRLCREWIKGGGLT